MLTDMICDVVGVNSILTLGNVHIIFVYVGVMSQWIVNVTVVDFIITRGDGYDYNLNYFHFQAYKV